MTAETLKPFITPASVDNYVTASHSSASSANRRSSRCLIAIAASALVVVLATSLLGITIWNVLRISHLQTEVDNLNKVIESMQKRLGLTYLDDLSDLEKEDENNNALIDDMLPDDEDDDDGDDDDNDSENNSGDDDEDEEDDDDDDDDDYTYDELIKKYSHYDDDDDEDDDDAEDNISEGDVLDDDDLYDDFGKYVDSVKKKRQGERKVRSVSTINEAMDDVPHQEQVVSRSPVARSYSHKSIVAGENSDRRRSPMKPYSLRRRKFPMIRSAKTVVQNRAFNEVELTKPAVHLHLTHKRAHSSLRIHTYNGDMYIGKPSWTSERDMLDRYFHIENGVVTVHESGLYYVYAQVCYHNHYPQNGFIIFHGHTPFLQCLSNVYTNNNTAFNTCHTSGLIYLKRDEQIHIRDFHADHGAHLEETNNRSYFGLIKI